MRITLAFVMFACLIGTVSEAPAACDTAGWATCEEVSGELFGDCSMNQCDRTYLGDDEDGDPVFSDQFCPRVNGQPQSGTAAMGGEVRVRILGDAGGYEGHFSSWTTGHAVICTYNYECTGCMPLQGMEWISNCKATVSNFGIYNDFLGVTPCDPYDGMGG